MSIDVELLFEGVLGALRYDFIIGWGIFIFVIKLRGKLLFVIGLLYNNKEEIFKIKMLL